MSDHHDHNHHAHGAQDQQPADGMKDPVCGMTVNPHTAKYRHVYNGRTYYFCSNGCREKFAADPQKYLDPAARAAAKIRAAMRSSGSCSVPMAPCRPACRGSD